MDVPIKQEDFRPHEAPLNDTADEEDDQLFSCLEEDSHHDRMDVDSEELGSQDSQSVKYESLPLQLAVGLWVVKSQISQKVWAGLREVLLMIHNGEDGRRLTLPKKVAALQRQVRTKLPMLRLVRQAVRVEYDELAINLAGRNLSMSSSLSHATWMYWFDPTDLVRKILSAPSLTSKMYFGHAIKTKQPTEMWHSNFWQASNIATSGRFLKSEEGHLILVGDVVHFKNRERKNGKGLFELPSLVGRVVAIHANETEDENVSKEPTARIEFILTAKQVRKSGNEDMVKAVGQLDSQEMVIVNRTWNIKASEVRSHLNVAFDYEWDGETPPAAYTGWVIRKKYMRGTSCCPLRFTHPPTGELEIAHFGRNHICSLELPADDRHDVLSLPILLVVDNVEIGGQHHRAFFWVPANLSYVERRGLANTFTFTIAPNNADLTEVMAAFENRYQTLARGMFLPINGRKTLVVAHLVGIVGDSTLNFHIPEEVGDSINNGCHVCKTPAALISAIGPADDVELRTYWDTFYLQQEGDSLDDQQRAAHHTKHGLEPVNTMMARIAPYLDFHRTRPTNVPSSEWRGMGTIVQSLLFHSILTNVGIEAYLKAFQKIATPPTWKQIRSPIPHMRSWSSTEAGRAMILVPLILRTQSENKWFEPKYLQRVGEILRTNLSWNGSPAEGITRAFSFLVESNWMTGKQEFCDEKSARKAIMMGRHCLRILLDAAVAPEAEAAQSGNAETRKDLSRTNHTVATEIGKNGGSPVRADLACIHQGQHLSGDISLYGTMMTTSCLTSEQKKREFAEMDSDTASPDLMTCLFAREQLSQSLRLGSAGLWIYSDPKIQQAFLKIEEDYQMLTSSLAPTSTDGRLQEDEEIADYNTYVGDDDHLAVAVDDEKYGISAAVDTFNLDGTTRLSEAVHGEMITQLERVLQNWYGVDETEQLQLAEVKLSWYRQVSFRDASDRLFVFKVGGYISYGMDADDIGSAQLDQVLVVPVLGSQYVFLIVRPLEAGKFVTEDGERKLLRDDTTDLAVYRLSSKQHIVGICGLQTVQPFFILAPGLSEGPDDKREYMLKCHWDIDAA